MATGVTELDSSELVVCMHSVLSLVQQLFEKRRVHFVNLCSVSSIIVKTESCSQGTVLHYIVAVH
jgi:hypothetical protein